MISSRYEFDNNPLLKLTPLQRNIKSVVESKISSNEYNFEKTECPFCEISESVLLSEKDRYGFYYPVVICKDCGLVFANPRMSNSSYNDFYRNYYRLLYEGKKTYHQRLFDDQMKRGKLISDYLVLNNIAIENKSILEVGCGTGGILYHFKEFYNCNVSGCDLTHEAIEFGRSNYDLDLKNGTIDLFKKEKKPDIIIYCHVFEHILDLKTELIKIKDICKDNTLIYIEVPGLLNIRNAYYWNFLLYLQSAHVYNFTLNSLSNLLQKNGFTLLHGTEYIRSIFRINNFETSSQTNEYDKIMSFLYQTEKYRCIGVFTKIKVYIKHYIVKILDKLHLKSLLKNILFRLKP